MFVAAFICFCFVFDLESLQPYSGLTSCWLCPQESPLVGSRLYGMLATCKTSSSSSPATCKTSSNSSPASVAAFEKKLEDLMCSLLSIVNNMALYTWQLLIHKYSLQQNKMWDDGCVKIYRYVFTYLIYGFGVQHDNIPVYILKWKIINLDKINTVGKVFFMLRTFHLR